MGTLSAMLAGAGRVASQEHERTLDARIQRRGEWGTALQAMAANPLLPSDLQWKAQQAYMQMVQLPYTKKMSPVLESMIEDLMIGDHQMLQQDAGQWRAAQGRADKATLGVPELVPPPGEAYTPSMPGVDLEGITGPFRGPEGAVKPPVGGLLTEAVPTPPPPELESMFGADPIGQEALRKYRMGKAAEQQTYELGQERSAAARDEHVRWVMDQPWFADLAPELQATIVTGQGLPSQPRPAQPSYAHLGAPKQFEVTEGPDAGKTFTGVPNKAASGYQVGADFYPFDITKPGGDEGSTSLSYLYYQSAKQSQEEKLGRPLTSQEDMEILEKARRTPPDELLTATRQLNLQFMRLAMKAPPLAELPGEQQQRISSIADRVLSGQYDEAQAIRMLGSPKANLAPALEDAIRAKKGIVLQPNDWKRMDGITTARNIVSQIEDMGEKIIKGENKLFWTNMLRTKLDTFAVPLARASGEVGTMTDQDVDRAKNLLSGWKTANFAPGWFRNEIKWVYQKLDAERISILKQRVTPITEAQLATPPPGTAPQGETEAGKSNVQRLVDKYK